MRERRKKVDNSGVVERCTGLVLRAFYNRWKIIHAAGEIDREGVHEGKVRVRKAAICPPLRGYAHKKTPWTNHGVDEGVTLGSLLFGERDVEHRIGGLGVLAIDNVDHLFDHIGVSGCDVVVFVQVFREIVKTAVSALND